MRVCIYIDIYIDIHVGVCVMLLIHTCLRAYIFPYIYLQCIFSTHIHLYLYACICIYIHVHIYVFHKQTGHRANKQKLGWVCPPSVSPPSSLSHSLSPPFPPSLPPSCVCACLRDLSLPPPVRSLSHSYSPSLSSSFSFPSLSPAFPLSLSFNTLVRSVPPRRTFPSPPFTLPLWLGSIPLPPPSSPPVPLHYSHVVSRLYLLVNFCAVCMMCGAYVRVHVIVYVCVSVTETYRRRMTTPLSNGIFWVWASSMLQCVEVCCSVLQCIAVCWAVCCTALRCVPVGIGFMTRPLSKTHPHTHIYTQTIFLCMSVSQPVSFPISLFSPLIVFFSLYVSSEHTRIPCLSLSHTHAHTQTKVQISGRQQ